MRFSRNLWGICLFLAVLLGLKMEDHLVDTMPAIRQVPTSQKVVALTFDDGPRSETTPEILNTLQEKKAKATFFVVGEQVQKYPALVLREITDGHEVGSHTFSHPRLTRLGRGRIEEELVKTEQALATTAPRPAYFRPPGGVYNDTVLQLARDHGYTIILWSIDTRDWRTPPVGTIVNTVLKDIKPGSIILLHDGKFPSPTPEAVGFIIDSLRSRGYEFVTISELLQCYESAK